MGLETGTYIDDLVETNPAAGDDIPEGDDHIRLLKSVLKNSFPSVSGAVSATHTELNALDGIRTNVAIDLTDVGNTFNVGNTAGAHLAQSQNALQAKASATVAATLTINSLGGAVNIGPQSGTGHVSLWGAGTKKMETTTSGLDLFGTTID